MRFDVVVIRKHELTLKFAAALLLLRPRAFFFLRATEGEVALHPLEWKPLLAWAWEKRRFLWSCLATSLPLAFLVVQLPLVFLRSAPWRAKLELLRTITANLTEGPRADSPFLFACLQVAMAHAFIFSRRPRQPPQRILLIRVDHIGDNVNT
ncbi:MAG: hypothetical protein HY713_12820, partial [candidate division NC10 bacterium]|nr:hypothetical protein [candidate division NC10 bacterium]